MNINRARQLAGLPLLERYASSAEFDADMSQLSMHLAAAKKIVDSANFKKHLQDTEQNFGADGIIAGAKTLRDSISQCEKTASKFYEMMINASE